MPRDDDSSRPASPGRRALLRAGWAAPVVLTAVPAPALAASTCGPFAAPSSADWSVVNTNMTTNGGTNVFLASGYRVVTDPGAIINGTASIVVSTNTTVRFNAGQTYTFTFNWTQYTANVRSLVFDLLVNGVAVGGSTIDTNATAGTNPRSVTYTSPTTQCYNVALRFVFRNEVGLNSTGDDIDITNLTRNPP